jgi:Zn-dependent protease
MSEMSKWSLPLGRWRRVQIRVHALFLVVGVYAMYLAGGQGEAGLGFGALAVGVLFASVLAHEYGHCYAATRLSGTCDPIVVGPLGGLGNLELPREPHAELFAILAGLLVNLSVLLVALPLMLLSGQSVTALLNPLEPGNLTQGGWWLAGLKLVFWINWLLVVANLLPAFPLDGARMLRAILWPALDYRGAGLVAVRASKLTAVGLCLVAWLLGDRGGTAALPAWLPLVMLAIWVFFSAQNEAARYEDEQWEDELFSYDFSQGYTSLERSSEPPRRAGSSVRRWLENRRELRRRRRETLEQEEERQVDEILSRLHQGGMEALSAKERALLHRVSQRYRNRQSH